MGKKPQKWELDERIKKQEDDIKSRSKIFSHLSASALALLFVFTISQFELDSLKGILVDGLYRTQWWSQPSPELKLIGYDDLSNLRYDANFIPAEEIVQVFEFLAEAKPKAIALIAPLNERVYSDSELKMIGKSLSLNQNVYVGYLDDESLGKNAPAGIPDDVRYLPGFISRDTFSYGGDSVSRRVMITIQSVPTIYSEMARFLRDDRFTHFRHTDPLGSLGDSQQTFVNWQGKAGSYPIISSEKVAQEMIPTSEFKDKVVLFGRALTKKSAEDFVFTPFNRTGAPMALVEASANSLVTLWQNKGLFKTGTLFNTLLSLIIGVLTVNMVLFLPPWRGILFVFGELVTLTIAGWLALSWFDCWIDLAHPLVVACVGYYLVIPYRLVDESRKRWHYQEKSELMTQLEQLKSNFLSLVTHDLKTPLARIQGNAELMLNGGKEFSPAEKKSLNAIVETTDYLSKYVQTVLDFTRIESARVQLNKASKDINAVIAEVIADKQLLAEEKNITITSSLEPMFSIKFDVQLIRRVLSNLVENAIKYSPEGSTINLVSEEDDHWIHVSVSDHGIGIPIDEQDKIFAKFYRCANTRDSEVKGTGLGLYLVKYFVELHEGMVRLKSEAGNGTTFVVSLPV